MPRDMQRILPEGDLRGCKKPRIMPDDACDRSMLLVQLYLAVAINSWCGTNPMAPNERSIIRSLVQGAFGDCPGLARYAIIAPMPPTSPASLFEKLPLFLLEEIGRYLSPASLCKLSQVNRYCEHIFCKNGFWRWRAELNDISKAVEARSWKWNFMAAECQLVYGRKLVDEPVFFNGAVTVIDPFKIFFTNSASAKRLEDLRGIARMFKETNSDFVVIYRGLRAVFITSKYWDVDTAFEVSRDEASLGVDEASSKYIAAIPKKLVDILVEENGKPFEGGVSFDGVDGQLLSSQDGDFIISRSTPSPTPRKICKWIEYEVKAVPDILCASGGTWTFSDDSSEEDEDVHNMDISDEEYARALAEEAEVLEDYVYTDTLARDAVEESAETLREVTSLAQSIIIDQPTGLTNTEVFCTASV